jgi:hypothetical protein
VLPSSFHGAPSVLGLTKASGDSTKNMFLVTNLIMDTDPEKCFIEIYID